MAIKVNGTTVIDDSRNFTNIAGGFKTVNGTSVVGSGNISAGASTTYGAVGTYTTGLVNNVYPSPKAGGDTMSGSSIYHYDFFQYGYYVSRPLSEVWSASGGLAASGLSGTWRFMAKKTSANYSTDYVGTLLVRIS